MPKGCRALRPVRRQRTIYAVFFCANGTAVCDDGVPLPLERRQLERGGVALAAAAGALAHPLIADGVLLVQTTGCRWKTLPK